MFCNYTKEEFWYLYNNKKYDIIYKAFDGFEFIEPIVNKNGLREFEGQNIDKELYNGFGAYTTYDLNVAIEEGKKMKAPIIVAFALKKGYNNFIVFDNFIRDIKKEDAWMKLTPKEMIEQLVDAEQAAMIDNYIKGCQDIDPEYREKGLDYFSTMPPKGGKQAKILCESLNVSNREKWRTGFIENEILKTRIRGYVFDGYINKKAVVVRDFGSIIPVQYTTDLSNTWNDNESLKDVDKYNELMINSVFPLFEYGKEYNDYHQFNHCSIRGLSNVAGKYGCNYMGARTHKHFFPVDVDNNDFNPFFTMLSDELDFMLNDHKFKLHKGDRYILLAEIKNNFHSISYDFFCALIKKICPEKPFYNDNILQDLIGLGY